MKNMSIQPLWLTHFIEFLLVLNSNSQNLLLARFLIRPILDTKFPLMVSEAFQYIYESIVELDTVEKAKRIGAVIMLLQWDNADLNSIVHLDTPLE